MRLARGAVAGLLLLAAPGAVEAQPAKDVRRLGYLSASTVERDRSLLAAFEARLQEHGWAEGRNLAVERRYADGRFERLPGLAAELVRLKVDVLVVAGAPAAHAAKQATGSIPIVMTNAADPVGTGLVASLAQPGGNVTGLSDFNAGVVTKRLEILREVVPAASRVAVLWNPANPTNPLQLNLTRTAAGALGVTLLSLEATGPADIERAFAGLARERPDALLVVGDPMLGSHRKLIVDLAIRHRLASIFSSRQHVDAGGLLSYGTSFADLYRRAATYVDKILRGARPADLPVEQPTTFELVVNLRTARALGVTVPPSVLLRADQLIE
jgi:putative ABC transport system substrate-binding protein